ncbi:MAG: hypothetical protein ACKOUM_08850 [Sphingopyxis sp.]
MTDELVAAVEASQHALATAIDARNISDIRSATAGLETAVAQLRHAGAPERTPAMNVRLVKLRRNLDVMRMSMNVIVDDIDRRAAVVAELCGQPISPAYNRR